MKKLMFMLALAAGLAANAGTVNWEFWDDSATASNDYILYLMEGNLTDGAKITDIKDKATANTFVADAAASGVMDSTDALYASGGTADMGSGNKDFYALIFNAATVDAASQYLVVGKFTANVPGSGAAVFSNDITGRTGSSAGWQTVPEPTSGLLMLVGLGALALRRRRA